MKNGLLIWNIVLTLAAGYLLFTHFNSGKKKAESSTGPVRTFIKDTSAIASSFRIAYFEMDSVENNLQLVRKVWADIDEREKAFNNEVARLELERTKRVEVYQQQVRTKEEAEKASNEMKQLDNDIRIQKDAWMQELQKFRADKQLFVKNTIKNFLQEYNKEMNFSYIFANEEGLFYYCDTAYNITGDVIKGLNEEYKKNGKD